MRGTVLALLLIAHAAAAQQVAPTSDHELVQQLLERVRQLEAEVQELKGHQTAPAPAQSSSAEATPAPTPIPAEPAASMHAGMGEPQGPFAGFTGMQFRGFSDVDYHASSLRGTKNSFALGQFNLFITSRLTDRLSFLAETVFEADQTNAYGVELERLLFTYAASDYLNVSIGRYHTAIGFYNTAYHHATWLQTAVDRPFLFAFEDDGGILPIHNVGITATGHIPSGGLGLHYVAEVGNGRASRTPEEPVQNVRDENNGKAVNFALYARPDAWRGFQAGFSLYHDRLTPLGLPTVGEFIYSGHVVYQGSRFEWLNEALVVRETMVGGRVLHTPGWYTQISRKFGPIRPYFRYQYVNVPQGDPLFSDVGLMHGPSFGTRWDFSDYAAFKLEYDRTELRRAAGYNGLATQVSFTF